MQSSLLSFIFFFVLLTSCVQEKKPDDTFSYNFAVMKAGDLVVTNYTGDSVLLLDSDGNFKRVIYDVLNNQEQVAGTTWNSVTKEILVTVNGNPDRIMSISPIDGSTSTLISNSNYSGSTLGVSVTSTGDFYAIESSLIEKFTSAGGRVNNGTFPTANLLTNIAQIETIENDGFVICAYGSDQVATYNSSAVQQANKVSGIAGTTDGYGCAQLPTGEIVTAWSGTTDTIAVYASTLAGVALATYSDVSILSNPRGIGVLANGNILVTDASYNYLVELEYDSTAGSLKYVRTIADALLSYPWSVTEVPSY